MTLIVYLAWRSPEFKSSARLLYSNMYVQQELKSSEDVFLREELQNEDLKYAIRELYSEELY